MRLVICASEFLPSPGGIAIHAHQLAQHLVQLGWTITVVTPQDHVPAATIRAFNRKQPYSIVRQRLGRTFVLRETIRFITLLFTLARQRPDVVLATGEQAVWSATLASKLLRRPILAVGHGSEFLEPHSLAGRLTYTAFNNVDAVVLVSQYTRQFMDSAGIKPRQSSVILNGADGNEFQPGLDTTIVRARYNIPPGPVILTVGAVKERKAHDVVIKALPRLVQEFPTLTYLIAGRPFIRQKLTNLAASLGVEKHVLFLGAVDQSDLPFLYNLCDIFVMVSRTRNARDIEGFGIVAVEAALSGKPSVVTRDCGLQEAIYDGETGILVHQDDPEDTARAIGRLLRDDDLRTRMGGRAQQRARAEATWQLRTVLYEEILRKLVKS